MDTQQLFDAIKVIADEAIAEAGIDKTITASIISGPAPNGSYKVAYFLEELECFPMGLAKYSPGDLVYVKILEGDFSKKKIIQGLTSQKTEDLQESIGSVVVGQGFNYIVSPRDYRLYSNSGAISLEGRLVDQINKEDTTHLRISSEIFSNFEKNMAGIDFGIELTLNRQSGPNIVLKLHRDNIYGNFQKLNGKKQSVIFGIGDVSDIVGASARYFTTDVDGVISFVNSGIDLINADFANAVIEEQYEIIVTMENNEVKASIMNEEFGELDSDGTLFKYSWFDVNYLSDGTKERKAVSGNNNKLPRTSFSTYCEVDIETIL